MTTEPTWLVSELFARHEELLDTPAIHRGTIGSYLSPFYRLGRLYRARLGGRRALRDSSRLVPAMLSAIEPQVGDGSAVHWTVLRAAWSLTDVAVLLLGPPGGAPHAIAKLPYTAEGVAHLRRQRDVLQVLHGDERLGSFRALVPTALADGVIGDQYYLIENVRPGTELRSVDAESEAYARALVAAGESITRLHRVTANTVIVGDAELERWIEAPLRLIGGLSSLLPRSARINGAVDEIRLDLGTALSGREVTTSWIHGDLWPGNLLVSTAGSEIQGIVDWGRAASKELPMHDLMQLVMHSPRLLGSYPDLGTAVRVLLRDPAFDVDELRLLGMARLPLPIDRANLRRMLLLYWMRYLATYLVKCPDKVRNQWWVRRNVADVFRTV